ncbi:MAG: FAD-binding oxidoreductase [Gemmatimonadota bacterium]
MKQNSVLDRLRALLGPVAVSRDPQGLPRAVPDGTEALALVLRTAHEEHWRVRVEGRGTWMPLDAPADLAVSTRGMDQVVRVDPADLVATVQAGAPLELVRRRLADHGMWLALDPPGHAERTLGSVVATGSSGPLRLGFGPARDQVLGCTVVTGEGRVIAPGGRVVKNVAGYDLTKLQVGGFGAFGVLCELHLRLRALPRADITFIARGSRDQLTAVGRDARDANALPAALELLSPAVAVDSDWVLAARFVGTREAVAAEVRQFASTNELTWTELPADRAGSFWTMAGRAALGAPVTLRLGTLVDGVDETIDLVTEQMGEGLVTAGAGNGMVRWSGEVGPDRIRSVRHVAAAREIPLTVERAPWPIRRAVGHFGAYREGVGQLVQKLRETFDPGLRFAVALEGSEA